MPRIADLREIDGKIWARLEEIESDNINTSGGQITIWSAAEIKQYKESCVRDFLIDVFNQWKDRL